MQQPQLSVTERLRPFVEARQQFTDLGTGWMTFLDYLRARRGADIWGTHRMEDLDVAARVVESDLFQKQPDGCDPRVERFKEFEKREDVLAAFEQFVKHRGLTG